MSVGSEAKDSQDVHVKVEACLACALFNSGTLKAATAFLVEKPRRKV